MGRSVSEQAAQAVIRGQKTKAVERTPEEILKDIRRNLGAHLAVTPLDTAFLLSRHDDAVLLCAVAVGNDNLKNGKIAELVAQIEASKEADLKSDLTAMHARILELEACLGL